MKTYHGFNYDVAKFDKKAALVFVLEHCVFMDANSRPTELQHEFIEEASKAADEIENSYNLRQDYKEYKVSSKKTVLISILAFLLGILFLATSPLTFKPNLGIYNVLLGAAIIIYLSTPMIILARRLIANLNTAQDLLVAIHDKEMDITELLTLIGEKNTLSMVKEPMSPNIIYNPSRKTIN